MSSNRLRKHSHGPLVIIEIGNDWLKMIQAEPSRGGVAVSKLYLERFSSAGPELSESISRVIKEQKFAKAPVICCLPRQVVTMRMLELPSMDPAEIADMVDLQSGKQTPYSKDEIVSDYRILGAEKSGYSRVMLVIVQRGVLRQRYHILEDAGVDVGQMSVTSEGLLNWCRSAASGVGTAGNVAAILDIDSFYSDFSVVAGGKLAFTRSILVGANQLIEDYETWREKLVKEIKQSFEMCQSEAQGKSPEKLIISGAGSSFEGLGDYLEQQVGLPVDVKDQLKIATKMPAGLSPADPEYHSVSITPLLGAAMAPDNLEFNLVPDSVMLRKGLIDKAKSLTAFGVLLMMTLVCASLYGTLKVYFKRDTLGHLQKEYREKEPAVKNVERMLAIIKADRERHDARFTVVNLLSEIHKLVPQGITLDLINIDTDKNAVVLSGEAGSIDDVRPFVAVMEKSPLFKGVTDTTKKGDASAGYRFQIDCTLEREE